MAVSYNALAQSLARSSCFIPKSYCVRDTKQRSRSNVVFASNDNNNIALQAKKERAVKSASGQTTVGIDPQDMPRSGGMAIFEDA